MTALLLRIDPAQLAPHDLARRGERQLGHELDLARVLMRGEAGLHEGGEVGLERLRADNLGPELNEGLHDLGTYLVGHADDTDHGDGGMAHQAFLDLARADAIAARGDDVVVAALEEDVAILVDAPEVAGQQPVAGELLRRRPGIAPVLPHNEGDVAPARGPDFP